jgi:uncharacterized membrane protein YphA (DoxX/SURF4 family)
MARRNRLNRAAARVASPSAAQPAPQLVGPAPASWRRNLPTQAWAPTAARVTLGLVLLWFGIHELTQPSLWTGYVPLLSPASKLAIGLVLFHGWVLSVLGVALALGVAPRLAAAASALLLAEIVVSLTVTGGLSDIVARDFGVLGLALAVFATAEQGIWLRD